MFVMKANLGFTRRRDERLAFYSKYKPNITPLTVVGDGTLHLRK